MPGNMKNMSRPPSAYLKNFYYDTCVYDPSVLSSVLKILGPERLTLGSDYAVGEIDPVGFIKRCPDLSESEKRMILGETARGILAR
jgi:aminocarboxymuconate-semialdehyde decarboxylase